MDQLPGLLSLGVEVVAARNGVTEVYSVPDVLLRNRILAALGADVDLYKRFTLVAKDG